MIALSPNLSLSQSASWMNIPEPVPPEREEMTMARIFTFAVESITSLKRFSSLLSPSGDSIVSMKAILDLMRFSEAPFIIFVAMKLFDSGHQLSISTLS